METPFLWWITLPLRTVRWLVVGIFGLAIGVRVAILNSGWFYWDDYVLAGRAARMPLMSTEYLFADHDGHMMPAAMALQWIVTHLAPWNYAILAAIMIGAQFGIWILWYRVLRAAFGLQIKLLLPLAMVLLSPLAWTSGTWWSAALNSLPLQFGLVAGAGAVLQMAMRGSSHTSGSGMLAWMVRNRLQITIVGSFLFALAFFEKSLIITVFLFGLAMALGSGRVRDRFRSAWRLSPGVWLTVGGITIAYVATYYWTSVVHPHSPASLGTALSAWYQSVMVGTVPALFGGPWTWLPMGAGSAVADTPLVLSLLCLALLLTFVLVTVRRNPTARWAWTVALIYVTLDVVVLAAGRLAPGIPTSIGASLRYTSDALIPIAMAVALSLMAVRTSEPVLQLDDDASVEAAPEADPPKADEYRGGRVLVGSALSAIVVSGVLLSATGLALALSKNASIHYTKNAVPQLAATDRASPLIPQAVPGNVLFPLAYPYNQTDWFFAPLRDRPAFSTSTDNLRILDVNGDLRPGVVHGVNGAARVKGCRYRAIGGAGPVSVPLERSVFDWNYTVAIGYLSSASTPITVGLTGQPPSGTTVAAGLHGAFVNTDGSGDHVLVAAEKPGSSVCVGSVVVGLAAPIIEPD
ncbi:MAG: hypothetical protein ACOYD0_04925 [Candidatus Nanopelagicales bacterium]